MNSTNEIKQINRELLTQNNWVTSRKFNKKTKQYALTLLSAIRSKQFDAENNTHFRKEIRKIVGFQLPNDIWTIVKDFLIVPASHPVWIVRNFITYALPITCSETFENLYDTYYNEIPILKKQYGYPDATPFMDMDCALSAIKCNFLEDVTISKIAAFIRNTNKCFKFTNVDDITIIKQYVRNYLTKHNVYANIDAMPNTSNIHKSKIKKAFGSINITYCLRYHNRPDEYFNNIKYRLSNTCHTYGLSNCPTCRLYKPKK